MKKKLLKSISAMGLTIALSAAAMAGTAQAAGGTERFSCGHDFETIVLEWCEEINSESHTHYFQMVVWCPNCRYVQDEGEVRSYIEAHDLRAADWPLRYRCADCGYKE